jgi:hypothetical protein
MEDPGIDDLEDQLAARMARQEIFNRKPRPLTWVLLMRDREGFAV